MLLACRLPRLVENRYHKQNIFFYLRFVEYIRSATHTTRYVYTSYYIHCLGLFGFFFLFFLLLVFFFFSAAFVFVCLLLALRSALSASCSARCFL